VRSLYHMSQPNIVYIYNTTIECENEQFCQILFEDTAGFRDYDPRGNCRFVSRFMRPLHIQHAFREQALAQQHRASSINSEKWGCGVVSSSLLLMWKARNRGKRNPIILCLASKRNRLLRSILELSFTFIFTCPVWYARIHVFPNTDRFLYLGNGNPEAG